jgi:hypothetical protein
MALSVEFWQRLQSIWVKEQFAHLISGLCYEATRLPAIIQHPRQQNWKIHGRHVTCHLAP